MGRLTTTTAGSTSTSGTRRRRASSSATRATARSRTWRASRRRPTAFTKGVAWGDYDNDGFPDLYVSNYGGENFLYHNNGDGTFDEVAEQLGVEKPIASFPTWFWDYDNDGWLDLFVASYVPSRERVRRGPTSDCRRRPRR